MNKLYFLLLLLCSAASAQTINFEDPDFKAVLLSAAPTNQIAKDLSGNYFKIDANSDGEIQESEAFEVSQLNIGPAEVSSINGIGNFTNLVAIQIIGNPVSNFDFSELGNLESAWLENIDYSQGMVHVNGGTHLAELAIQNSAIGDLAISGKNFQSVNLSGLASMWILTWDQGDLSTVNLSGCTSLKTIQCLSTSAVSLSFHDLPEFDLLILHEGPNLQSLSIANCPNFQDIDLDASPELQLLELDAPQLSTISIWNTGLQELDLTQYPNLESADLNGNELASVNVIGMHNLLELKLSHNHLATLDLSGCSSLQWLDAAYNDIEYLFAKNGSNESMELLGNPLRMICADEFQLEALSTQYGTQNMSGEPLVISSYCTFVPGGEYNIITGKSNFDWAGDGCSDSEPAMPAKIRIDDGTMQGYVYPDQDGDYAFYVGSGNFTLTPDLENPIYFTVSPESAVVNFASEGGSVANQDFCFAANGSHPDLEVAIVPYTPARPGFEASYSILLRNKGNQMLSGTVTFTYEEDKLDFVSASEIPVAQSAGSVSFSFESLQVFATQNIEVFLNVNAPTDTPAVNIDDVLNFTAVASPSDENPTDNTAVLAQTVVGSYDPNDKICLEGGTVSPTKIGEYLHYVINFENTGTFPAENVVVADVIDTAKFDLSTFQLLSASHPNVTRITGNKAEFIFEGINLGVEEHGRVVFKIKTKNTLVEGDSVMNKANIYFDYNFPIETNQATTVFQQLSVGEIVDLSMSVYPNPTSGIVKIKADSEIKSVSVYDAQGRLVNVGLADSNETQIDLSGLQQGVYFVKAVSGKGSAVHKVAKK